MTHPSLKALTVSISSLILLAGCASSQSRDEHASHDTPDQHLVPTDRSPYHNSDTDEQLVISGTIIEDMIPEYKTPIKEFTLDEIRAELETMYEFDQHLVQASIADEHGIIAAENTVAQIDRVHALRLKEIVLHIGWPTREHVGLRATQGAYMVIQHAGNDIQFQNQCLALMVDQVEQGKIPASYVALLTDRIRVFQGESQVFGTQMELSLDSNGIMQTIPSTPIENLDQLDSRRALMGMPPHREFVDAILITYEASLIDTNNAFAHTPTDTE